MRDATVSTAQAMQQRLAILRCFAASGFVTPSSSPGLEKSEPALVKNSPGCSKSEGIACGCCSSSLVGDGEARPGDLGDDTIGGSIR